MNDRYVTFHGDEPCSILRDRIIGFSHGNGMVLHTILILDSGATYIIDGIGCAEVKIILEEFDAKKNKALDRKRKK